MKKTAAAILISGVILGLLFFCAVGDRLALQMQDRGRISAVVGENVFRQSGNEAVDSGEDVGAEKKKIALTFDDGPHPTYTDQLLDGLKERGVQATFFVTGEHAALHPDVILRMRDDA